MISWKTRNYCLSAYHMRTDPMPEAHNKNDRAPSAQGSPPAPSPTAWRSEMRRQAIALRLRLSGEELAQRSRAICDRLLTHFPQLAAMRVGFCWPMKNEPDLLPLLTAWNKTGGTSFAALLPVVVAPDAPLAFRAWTPDTPMDEDRYGIPTPATGDFLHPQALLIPLVAFDAAGYRLGYGGGFFDRTRPIQARFVQPRPHARRATSAALEHWRRVRAEPRRDNPARAARQAPRRYRD